MCGGANCLSVAGVFRIELFDTTLSSLHPAADPAFVDCIWNPAQFLCTGWRRNKKGSEAKLHAGPSLPKNNEVSIDGLRQRIKEHNGRVRRIGRNRACYRSGCANCGEKDFAPHDLGRRPLRWMEGNEVVSELIWLARWRCRNCRRSFTDYPDFRPAVQALRRPLLDLASRGLS